MEPMFAEKIWKYLHDDPVVVKGRTFVGNRGLYLNGLIDILYWASPDMIVEIKSRMLMEKATDKLFYGDLFLREREGYGQTEYRLIKLFKGSKSGQNLEKYFPELLIPLKEKPKYISKEIDLKLLESDINYRSSIYISYHQLDPKIVEDVDSLMNQSCMLVTDLIWYGPELPEKTEDPKEKVRRPA